MTKTLKRDALPGSLDDLLMRLERNEFLAALRTTGGQRSLAAHQLGISRTKFYRRLEALGIDLNTGLADQPPQDVPQTEEGTREQETRSGIMLARALAELERREIVSALQKTGGHRTRTARDLGISRSRLYRRVEALGIDLATCR